MDEHANNRSQGDAAFGGRGVPAHLTVCHRRRRMAFCQPSNYARQLQTTHFALVEGRGNGMRFTAYAALLGGVVLLALGCGAEDEENPEREAPAAAVAPGWEEGSTLVELITRDADVLTRSPVILTPGPDRQWSSALRLVCRSNCERALLAFGYRTKQFVREYESEEALRAGERLDLPLVDLAMDGPDEQPVLAAYRVVDAREPRDPRYLVRLRAAPDKLYAPLCEDFLRGAQGSLETVPIGKALFAQWGLPLGEEGAAPVFPRIGCNALDGKLLPAPAVLVTRAPSWEAPAIASVWTVTRRESSIRSSTYPYVVTRDARGELRGFAVDCGSDAFAALASLGIAASDIRGAPATDQELEATRFGEQPVMRCAGAAGGGATILAIQSPNDATASVRFRFEGARDLVEFTCVDTERFWSARAAEKLELPLEALAHLSDSDGSVGATRVFKVGCRSPKEPRKPSACAVFRQGEGLRAGETQRSCNGRFSLTLHADGNLALYRGNGMTWSSRTGQTNARMLTMQADGNLVLYDPRGRPIWASATFASGAHADVQNDGHFVLYDGAGKPLWKTDTWQPPIDLPTECGIARPGQGLLPGETLWSCDHRFVLTLQTDGNLVLYQGNTALWSSVTHGKPAAYVSMQPDGNFVVYADPRKALWATGTHGKPGAYVAVQNDGNLVVYSGNTALWDSKTGGR